jgi:multimeric flavodoxin WrbA
MKTMIIMTSPNRDGLTAACAQSAIDGIIAAGHEVLQVRLNELPVGNCKACGGGWGTCRDKHECQVQDGFQALHHSIGAVDALVIVTPVYWGEMSESAKAFTDRFRRCEALKSDNQGMMRGKPVLCIAAAGGSGNGFITCLASMERWCQHMGAERADMIGVTRRSRNYGLDRIREAAAAMVESKA